MQSGVQKYISRLHWHPPSLSVSFNTYRCAFALYSMGMCCATRFNPWACALQLARGHLVALHMPGEYKAMLCPQIFSIYYILLYIIQNRHHCKVTPQYYNTMVKIMGLQIKWSTPFNNIRSVGQSKINQVKADGTMSKMVQSLKIYQVSPNPFLIPLTIK